MKWTYLLLAFVQMHISMFGVIGMIFSGGLAILCLHYAKRDDSIMWFLLSLLPGFPGFFGSLGMFLIGK